MICMLDLSPWVEWGNLMNERTDERDRGRAARGRERERQKELIRFPQICRTRDNERRKKTHRDKMGEKEKKIWKRSYRDR